MDNVIAEPGSVGYGPGQLPLRRESQRDAGVSGYIMILTQSRVRMQRTPAPPSESVSAASRGWGGWPREPLHYVIYGQSVSRQGVPVHVAALQDLPNAVVDFNGRHYSPGRLPR